MPEMLRGKSLPPAPVASAHGIKLIGEATRIAQSPVEQVAHAVIDRIMHEMREVTPGKTYYKVEAKADAGLAWIMVTTEVRLQPKELVETRRD